LVRGVGHKIAAPENEGQMLYIYSDDSRSEGNKEHAKEMQVLE
jgi:hypothetical protein